jgi:hypothetical protein
MIPPAYSFNKFHYGLRPSKLVERKLMIEVLLHLFKAGFDIPSYTYMGFGSVYYVDFIMFHKSLFIRDMICVEWGDIRKRMEFNKPYNFIRLRMGAVLDHVHLVRQDLPFLVWLDYDRPLDDEALLDFNGFLGRLSPGSIFIVSVESRARPVDDDADLEELTQAEKDELMLDRYNEWFAPYLDHAVEPAHLGESVVSDLYLEVCRENFRTTLLPRGLDFAQLFNFWYKDGAPMWTIGGMITAAEDEQKLRREHIRRHPFVVTGKQPLIVSVPPLTVREKLMLDVMLPKKKLTKKMAKIELSGQALRNYKKFYKEYPTFTEAIL